MNFPACTLLGGPFTSLAVTQNYRSNLHAEPKEHPFSYIAWLDVLSAGSTMEVGGTAGAAVLCIGGLVGKAGGRGGGRWAGGSVPMHCSG